MPRTPQDPITPENYLYSEDIIARIEHLSGEDYPKSEEEQEELADLLSLQNELSGYCPDWHHGITLISEPEFPFYCKGLVRDCGYINDDFPEWIAIDWKTTSENIRVDYTEADFQGKTYLAR